jgi:hypothetical protein
MTRVMRGRPRNTTLTATATGQRARGSSRLANEAWGPRDKTGTPPLDASLWTGARGPQEPSVWPTISCTCFLVVKVTTSVGKGFT